jgi:hypothetical protein
MMGIIVKHKKFDLLAEGLHNAVISRIEDPGIVETASGWRDKARIFFAVLDEEAEENGEVFLSVTKVFDGKNNISKVLKSLKISHGEEFDFLELVGAPCCVVIQHNNIEGQAEPRANVMAVLTRR